MSARTSLGSAASATAADVEESRQTGSDDIEQDNEDEDTVGDAELCEFCGKDLSEMRGSGKPQHRKACQKRLEEAKHTTGKRPLELQLPKACPVCQKPFGKGFNERNITVHFQSSHGFSWELGGPLPKPQQRGILSFMSKQKSTPSVPDP